jgi:nucleoside-diphosphate-sugar epimerase
MTNLQNHQKIAVFGATGTIGKAVVAALSQKYEVLQVGNRQGYRSAQGPAAVRGKYLRLQNCQDQRRAQERGA